MGNNPSRPAPAPSIHPPSSSQTASSTTLPRREPKRRESLQALSSAKATAAPPSESLESATAHSSAQHSGKSSPSHPRFAPSTVEQHHVKPSDATMGNEFSRQGHDPSENDIKPYSPSKPVDVPAIASDASTRAEAAVVQPSAPPSQAYHIAASQTHRPPRLPLPIEEELHTPGSPIISPADVSSALDHDSVEGVLPRRNSVLSSTTIDDDEIGDELHADTLGGETRRVIPTVIEWKQRGDKVYVTGTFANWNRKFRLHYDPSKECLAATIPLPPGTHHLKFIVDGDMRTSDTMPTAVDYTNILVNYLEVSADDLPQTQLPASEASKTQPEEASSGQHPDASAPGAQATPPEARSASDATPRPVDSIKIGGTGEEPATVERPRRWTNKIPQYLLDLDLPEGSEAYERAARAINSLPPPPSLPLFLSRSILNGSTPMKDDSSVLNMPNHTTLNHLTTSSIKDGVLATSVTTRYKKKHVTTILYKPTSEEDE
ncbi:MAG: hypothetical protein M1817_006509 [Caeruleum heppii]|nr:MAG: hypothetical protein M1817_006509 [Caeruleum heppii]